MAMGSLDRTKVILLPDQLTMIQEADMPIFQIIETIEFEVVLFDHFNVCGMLEGELEVVLFDHFLFNVSGI